MKYLKDIVLEKLIIRKDSELKKPDIKIIGHTDFTKEELEEIKNCVVKHTSVDPIEISNMSPGNWSAPQTDEIYIYYINIEHDPKWLTYVDIIKKGNNNFLLECALYGYIYNDYQDDKWRKANNITDLFDNNENLDQLYKKIASYYRK